MSDYDAVKAFINNHVLDAGYRARYEAAVAALEAMRQDGENPNAKWKQARESAMETLAKTERGIAEDRQQQAQPPECPARLALEIAIMTVECASIDVRTGEELPWYKAAHAALATLCICEELRAGIIAVYNCAPCPNSDLLKKVQQVSNQAEDCEELRAENERLKTNLYDTEGQVRAAYADLREAIRARDELRAENERLKAEFDVEPKYRMHSDAAWMRRVDKLTSERDDALRARDLAREASNRDLEAKRAAERHVAAIGEQLEFDRTAVAACMTAANRAVDERHCAHLPMDERRMADGRIFCVQCGEIAEVAAQSTAGALPPHADWCQSLKPIHDDGPCNCNWPDMETLVTEKAAYGEVMAQRNAARDELDKATIELMAEKAAREKAEAALVEAVNIVQDCQHECAVIFAMVPTSSSGQAAQRCAIRAAAFVAAHQEAKHD